MTELRMRPIQLVQLVDNDDNLINPVSELQAVERVTTTDEFVASGVEAAFKSYTISAGNRTLVKGELNVFDSLNVIGTLKVIGTVNIGI